MKHTFMSGYVEIKSMILPLVTSYRNKQIIIIIIMKYYYDYYFSSHFHILSLTDFKLFLLSDFHLSFVVNSFLFHIFLVCIPAIVLYYFNTHLVLIHYWSLGWTKGHSIRAAILRLSAAWHSCTREKLYQLWNQPAATSKSDQLSHWKAFCSIAINGLLVTRRVREWGCKKLLDSTIAHFS